MLTHAGITEIENPYLEDHDDSVLWNRQKLKNIDKLQVHGHTPLKQKNPLFDAASNSINIDTAVVYGYGLTGIKVDGNAVITESIIIDTDARDIAV